MAGERQPCGCWGECSHPACLTGPSGVCCRMNEPAPSPDPAAGEHDWRQDGPYHWRCDRCGQREQQREKAKDCAPSPDPAALWALVRRWREEASAKPRPDRAYHHGERNKARRCADELAALLPPEGP